MIRFAPCRRVCLALCCVLAVASVASAQADATRVQVPHNQVLSANPFLLMFKYVNVEFERKTGDFTSFGASASTAGFDDATYSNFQAFYRYYPQGMSLTGFYIGARGGVHRVSDDLGSGHAFGLGFELGYGWLIGPKRNFAISLGGGATRLFGGDLTRHSLVFPTIRLVTIGWSF